MKNLRVCEDRGIMAKQEAILRQAQGKQEEPLEKQLRKAAHKLRNNIYADGYKHVVLGLIFLKSISNVFEKLLPPGRYIGLPNDEDDFIFAERFSSLKTELEAQLKEIISANLLKINLNNNS